MTTNDRAAGRVSSTPFCAYTGPSHSARCDCPDVTLVGYGTINNGAVPFAIMACVEHYDRVHAFLENIKRRLAAPLN